MSCAQCVSCIVTTYRESGPKTDVVAGNIVGNNTNRDTLKRCLQAYRQANINCECEPEDVGVCLLDFSSNVNVSTHAKCKTIGDTLTQYTELGHVIIASRHDDGFTTSIKGLADLLRA